MNILKYKGDLDTNNSIALLIILAIVLVVCIIMGTMFKGESNKSRNVLIYKSYSNYAYSSVYNGTVIMTDGSIYTWNSNGLVEDDLSNENNFIRFINNKGTKKINIVNSSDLEQMKEYINSIKYYKTLSTNCHGADIGETKYSIFINGMEVPLKINGDCDGETNNKNAIKLIELADKYLN